MNTQSMTGPIRILSIVLALLALTACPGDGGAGGGGGGETPPSSNWDQLVWDQGNWL